MTAKRTLREIRRMSELTSVILESAKKLGPGNGRHSAFMDALQRLDEFKTLPSWRKAYLQGHVEGASAILALVAAGAITAPAAAPEKRARTVEPVAALERLPARPIEAAVERPRVHARAVEPEVAPVATLAPAPVDGELDDAKALAWLARVLKAAASQGPAPSQPPRR